VGGAEAVSARLSRIAAGPDEARRDRIARLELKRHDDTESRRGGNAHVPSPDRGGDVNCRPRWIS
jgi:hypothetical protein